MPLMIGAEQEFELFSRGKQLDFRALFPQAVKGVRSFPFRNCEGAVILDSGYMLGSDGKEAEFATVPINSNGAGCLTLAREVSRCRNHLIQLLETMGVRDVRGYSTHLNISVPFGREDEIASAISTTVAPSLILLMEAQQSPGLLIRPRRGRLEIGSEYIDDEKQLAAGAVFLAGVVSAYLRNGSLWNQFPRIRLKRSEEGNIRPGIYLPRDAYGESLHDLGRQALLELENGQTLTAGEALELCTDLVCRELDGQISDRSIYAMRHVVVRVGSLQIDRHTSPGAITRRISYAPAVEARTLQMLTSGLGSLGLVPRFLDWEGAAFSLQKVDSSLIVGVPWAYLPEFFRAARKKVMPQFIGKLGQPESALNTIDQFRAPQVYKEIDPVALGDQALNDNRKNNGQSGGSFKPPQQLKPEDLEQTIISRLPKISPSPIRFPKRYIYNLLIFMIVILSGIAGGVFVFNHKTLQPTVIKIPILDLPPPAEGTLMAWVGGSTLVFNGNAWIYQSQVTNYQFSLCLEAGSCQPPAGEAPSPDINDPDQANSPAQIIGPEAQQAYCEWAGGRIPTDAENEAIGVDSGSPSAETTPGFKCAVDSPHPMAAACQTSAYYLNGAPPPMDHSVTEAGHFCQNGQSFVTLDINIPEGGSIESVTGDCQVVGGNRMLCSATPGTSGGGAVEIQCNGMPAVQDSSSPAAGQMQCLPGYEVNGDLPTQCDFNKLLPAVQKDPGPLVAQLQSSQDQFAGQVSLVVYRPNMKRQECGAGQYRNRDTDVCEDIPPCPSGMVFDGVAGCAIPSPTPQGGFPCPPGTYFSQVTLTCERIVCDTGTHWNERTLTCEPSCVGGGGWDPVTGECYPSEANAQLAPCPIGLFRGPDGYCVSLVLEPPGNECQGGFHFDDSEQCCLTDLPSGRYPGCPAGQANDLSAGACDSDNIWLDSGMVLHTVEFSFDAPSCETKDNSGGGDDAVGCNLSCPKQKLDPVTCSCY